MLYLVPTPIGNLEDITLKALRILKEVDLVLAEDTRTSKKLFQHYAIETPLRSYHAHNEHKVTEAIIEQLQAGSNIALISDAGTPAISDPGFLLVRACREADITVECLPGAVALIPALVGSGLPADKFYFEGFLPHKKGRQTRWKFIAELPCSVVLYESPHRIGRCLKEIVQYCGADRKVAVVRELTKMYESYHTDEAQVLVDFFEQHPNKAKGEMVIVIEGKSSKHEKKKQNRQEG